MKLDILALAAHPDDAELGCAGTLLRHIAQGKKAGVVDLTRGELGTRGTPELRDQEAAASSAILGLSVRRNLRLADGFFQGDAATLTSIVRVIREFRPDVVLANAKEDRHPDHGRAAEIETEACFLAGLAKFQTTDANGAPQQAWRPKAMYHYIQSQFIIPDIVVDITAYWEKKMEAVMAFKSQFYDPSSKEPETFISSPAFLKLLEARAIEMGIPIGVRYAEGFTASRWIGVDDLTTLR